MSIQLRLLALALLCLFCPGRPALAGERGILLLAHGGNGEWNARVTDLAAEVGRERPTEVAFGMATRATLQAAVDRLVARGVTEIVAVPLFVSSWSSVITSTEYLLGLRADAPPALAVFAKMNHGSHGEAGGHEGHTGVSTVDGTTPVRVPVPIRMAPALNDHPVVAEVLLTRARALSRAPSGEAVVIVAHGPDEDEENRRWLADMASVAARIRAAAPFAAVESLTVRDDAPNPIRERATRELREVVSRHISAGRRVLVVPLLVSFGGIERGIRERLDGLSYVMADAGLMPDTRLVAWVLAAAGSD